MTWEPITRRGRRIESAAFLYPVPRSRRGRDGRAQPVPLTILIEAPHPWVADPGTTVAVIHRPPYTAPAPAARYLPATLILAILARDSKGWSWRRLAEAALRNNGRAR